MQASPRIVPRSLRERLGARAAPGPRTARSRRFRASGRRPAGGAAGPRGRDPDRQRIAPQGRSRLRDLRRASGLPAASARGGRRRVSGHSARSRSVRPAGSGRARRRWRRPVDRGRGPMIARPSCDTARRRVPPAPCRQVEAARAPRRHPIDGTRGAGPCPLTETLPITESLPRNINDFRCPVWGHRRIRAPAPIRRRQPPP